MSNTPYSDAPADAEQLEERIDHKRGEISRTLDQLERQLSPGQLVDQLMDTMREHGGDMAAGLSRTARDNPLPLLLTGVGLAWLMASQSSAERSYGSYPLAGPYDPDEHDDRYREHYADNYDVDNRQYRTAAGGMGDSTQEGQEGGVVDSLQDKASEMAEGVRGAGASARSRLKDTGSQASARLRDARREAAYRARHWHQEGRRSAADIGVQARSAARQARSYFEQEPLVAGALGVALGAVIGSLIPPTQAEDQHLGEVSDRITDQARAQAAEAASTAREKVQEQAGKAGESATATFEEKRPDSEHAPSDKVTSPA